MLFIKYAINNFIYLLDLLEYEEINISTFFLNLLFKNKLISILILFSVIFLFILDFLLISF